MDVLGIIFANIYDSSLGQLTNKRTMASLPFGGRYRHIDFPLSNMANAGIHHIGIITKYNYQSLINHVGSGLEWDLALGEGNMEFLTPFSMGHSGTYRGKLEAVNSAAKFIAQQNEEYVILSDSNVLCSIDLTKVLEAHIASGCDVTAVTKSGIADGKKELDLAIKTDDAGQVTQMAVDYVADASYDASMGIFVMKRTLLMEAAKESTSRNRYRLERDFILRSFDEGDVYKRQVLRLPVLQPPGRLLHRPESGQRHLPGRQLEAQGDRLHPLGSLPGGRAQARAHQPDRGRHPGHGHGHNAGAL